MINKKHKKAPEVKPKNSFFLNFSIKNYLRLRRQHRDKKYKKDVDDKIGIAFLFPSLYGNGIGRMLSLLANELVKIEKYDIYMITKGNYTQDFNIDERVIRLNIYENNMLINNLDKKSNILYYILNNELDSDKIDWIRTFNKKVIDIMHGAYFASIYFNSTEVYTVWKVQKSFDAFITVVPDDIYIFKNLGMNNSFFIPNLLTFDPAKTPSSNLTYNNLIVLGRLNDVIKGAIYAIKAMEFIVKEVPDAKLYFISSDYRIDSMKKKIKELNLEKNIEILPYVANISKYFLNSSILLCPSLSEAFPMAVNEGKAHGLPIVSFNISYSAPIQKGVIVVGIKNYTQMAKEAIKLLKDYDYRKKMGMEAKLSLNDFSNEETINKWDRLFTILDKDDPVAYKKLQEYTYEKYYDEEKARERLESNFNFVKSFNKVYGCHTFNNMINLSYIENIKDCNITT
jgi:glycosyltransferase involved in cell wall biosynthesis